MTASVDEVRFEDSASSQLIAEQGHSQAAVTESHTPFRKTSNELRGGQPCELGLTPKFEQSTQLSGASQVLRSHLEALQRLNGATESLRRGGCRAPPNTARG